MNSSHFILNHRTVGKRNKIRAFEQPRIHLRPMLVDLISLTAQGDVYNIGGGTIQILQREIRREAEVQNGSH